ncbi:hypothetical protein KSP40_PGU011015 [Platanthera guangdongensis]|uniref:Uncharacterized protein n=1 Tax=Platanthera guangdongensis TaxID=2320717 RepID=A0ABR2MJ90_9ASPA
MGNALVSPCFPAPHHGQTTAAAATTTKLIFWGGEIRHLPPRHLAGELMFEFPDSIVCHADSFFIGKSIPSLSIDDELLTGDTYFVLPADRLPSRTLTPASIALLSSSKGKTQAQPLVAGVSPFEYVKGGDGQAHIRVLPEFIAKLITFAEESTKESKTEEGETEEGETGEICSTPELKKHYELLVGSRSRQWSPRLETIKESYKLRMSPGRLLACDRR